MTDDSTTFTPVPKATPYDYTEGYRQGYAAAKRTADPVASLLISFPDVDGNPVFFDPALVTGLRQVVDNTRHVVTTLVFVGVTGGTTQVFTVLEGASLVGDRINMHRRGLGPQMDQAVAEMRKRSIRDEQPVMFVGVGDVDGDPR